MSFPDFHLSKTKDSGLYDNLLPSYIQNVTNEDADIYLFDEIGNGGISGQKFADEIKLLNEFGVKLINVHINSPGGGIVEGYSIFAAIRNSKTPVHTHIVGLAASMAGVIAMAGEHITIVDYGRLMIHNPSGSAEPDEKEKEVLESLKDSLIQILKNRTGKSKEDLSNMMDVETWLNPKEAMEGGFVDEIVSTKQKKNISKRQPLAEIANFFNLNTIKINSMKNLCALLGIIEDSTEQVIIDAVKAIQTSLEKAKGSLTTLQSELNTANETITTQKATIKAFEDKQADMNKQAVTDTVDQAVKDGKLDEKDKPALIAKFENNLEGLKMIVTSFKSAAVTITDKLKNGTASIPAERKDWTFRDWEKKDAKGLDKIKTSSPDLYKKMYKDQYQVELA